MNHHLSQRLRELTQELRRTPKPLAEIIPLLNEAADELDRRTPAPTSEPGARDAVTDVDILAEIEVVRYIGNFHSLAFPTDAATIAFARAILALATPASPAVPASKPQPDFPCIHPCNCCGTLLPFKLAPRADDNPVVPARLTGLLKEALAWIEGSAEPAPSLCGDLRKELGLPPCRAIDCPGGAELG